DNESCRNLSLQSGGAANGIYLWGAPNTLLQRNRLHHNQDTGLQIGPYSNGCVSVQNQSWRNGDHGFDHVNAQNTVNVGNLAYRNYRDGFSIEGSSSGTHVSDCIAIENGLTSREFDLWVDGTSTSGLVSDYNLFWNSNTSPPVKY